MGAEDYMRSRRTDLNIKEATHRILDMMQELGLNWQQIEAAALRAKQLAVANRTA